MRHLDEARWRKSSLSASTDSCVELHTDGAVRDSKNPDGPIVEVPLGALLLAARSGRLDLIPREGDD